MGLYRCGLLLGLLGAQGQASAQITLREAVAQFDALTEGYNLLSLGNANFADYTSVQGAVAVGGDLTLFGSGVIAERAGAGGQPSLFVSGRLVLEAGQQTDLAQGYAYLPRTGGEWDKSARTLTTDERATLVLRDEREPLAATDPRESLRESPWDWSRVGATFTELSTFFGEARASGSLLLEGETLVFSSKSASKEALEEGVLVFTLDGRAFSGNLFDADADARFDTEREVVSRVRFDVPDDLVFVINVVNFGGGTVLDGLAGEPGAGDERLLWNITPDEKSGGEVALGGVDTFRGSVLAPLVDVQNARGIAPEGQIVAANYTHSGAGLGYLEFSASSEIEFTVIPEPAVAGVAGLALMLGAAACRRRPRSAG